MNKFMNVLMASMFVFAMLVSVPAFAASEKSKSNSDSYVAMSETEISGQQKQLASSSGADCTSDPAKPMTPLFIGAGVP
jgi:hypothetical protein